MLLVTGGAGFIGSNFIGRALEALDDEIVNLDLLTYSGDLINLVDHSDDPRLHFSHGDICDASLVRQLLDTHRPRAVLHFAAESHVDRSIECPDRFLTTNVHGTFVLLQETLKYYRTLPGQEQDRFRFIHISTDEVYGSLGPDDPPFNEYSRYAPNSPYSASKAASDHLVRAYHRTYGLPTIVSNCSNNYGPRQFPEKLIPLTLMRARQGLQIPVYGSGKQERDWLFVEDHCDALLRMLDCGHPGEVYLVGGSGSISNLQIIERVCAAWDELAGGDRVRPSFSLVEHVDDRPGHDFRYDIDTSKAARELDWKAQVPLQEGIERTVRWYMENEQWIEHIAGGEYRSWVDRQYDMNG